MMGGKSMKMFEHVSITEKIGIILLVIFGVMFLLPLAAIHFPGDSSLAILLFLFYIFNPIFVFGIGYWSGKQWRKMWYVPLLAALLYLLFSWILFTYKEILFVYYAAAYLGIGLVGLWLSAVLNRKGSSRI